MAAPGRRIAGRKTAKREGFTTLRNCLGNGDAMTPRINPEITLKKEHAARESRRAGTYLLNLVAAGLVLGAAAAAQYFLGRSDPWITGVAVAVALVLLLALRISLQWDRAVVL